MKLINHNGYPELVAFDNCSFDEFYKFADYLQRKLGISFTEKIDDFDELYYVFEYKYFSFVLYYSSFLGVSIYSKNTKFATNEENELLNLISESLK